MPLSVAVQMDPIETINIDADSTFALMLEAQLRDRLHAVPHYEVRHHEALARGNRELPGGERHDRLLCTCAPGAAWNAAGTREYSFGEDVTLNLGTMDVVLMRQDPPFDMAYITATHLLEHIHPRTRWW